MKTVELKEKGAIFFERIEEGFSDYKDEIIVLQIIFQGFLELEKKQL